LSGTCPGLCRKVGVMEFGLYAAGPPTGHHRRRPTDPTGCTIDSTYTAAVRFESLENDHLQQECFPSLSTRIPNVAANV